MTTIAFNHLFAIAMCGFAALFVYWTARALTRGQIWVASRTGGGWMVTRRFNPIGFWLWMLLYFVTTAMAAAGAFLMWIS